jgi:hypothetical protein
MFPIYRHPSLKLTLGDPLSLLLMFQLLQLRHLLLSIHLRHRHL